MWQRRALLLMKRIWTILGCNVDGEVHGEFKKLVKEQIRHILICFEGETKRTKVRSVMKWWLKCISMIMNKTASRNVTFNAARMSDRIMESQDEFIRRCYEEEEIDGEAVKQAALDDIGFNADLCI